MIRRTKALHLVSNTDKGDGVRQLALDLTLPPRLEPEDFLVGPTNETAFMTIGQWPAWTHPVLRLEGPRGSGKTHLAHIWAAQSHAWQVNASDIVSARVPELLAPGALVIEDVDSFPGDEAAFFHLLNLTRERGLSLLITSRTAPMQWGLTTPDLLSRLRQAPVVSLGAPDDALFRAVLVKLFFDRQLVVNLSVVEYLALHLERSFVAAQNAVAALDTMAYGAGRAISRQLAAEYIASLSRDRTLFAPHNRDGD